MIRPPPISKRPDTLFPTRLSSDLCPVQLRVVQALAYLAGVRHPALAARQQHQPIMEQVVAAEELAPHADRPGGRRRVERQRLLDLADQVERLAALAVELVDEGHDRHVISDEHTSALQALMHASYALFFLKNKNTTVYM